MSESPTLLISQIRTDGATQSRAELNNAVIEEYAEAMRAGITFPPLAVFYDGSEYWLADGFHRIAAAGGAELDRVAVEIRQGTREDAQWHSYGANQEHGLRRSNADKQRAARAALEHSNGKALGDREISRHIGVSPSFVSHWRKELSVQVGQIGQAPKRTVTRAGSTFQQNVTNIGSNPPPRRTVSPIRTEPEYSEAAPESVGVENLIRHFEFMRLLRRVPLTPREMDALSVDLHGIELYEESAERLREIAAKAAHLRDAKDVPA